MALKVQVRTVGRPVQMLRRILLACLLLKGALGVGHAADDVQYFRIGTAATTGTYFAIGGIIAGALSNPPGSRNCDRGGNCGVPNMIAVATATEGSVDNVRLIASGLLDSGLCQADVAYWAFRGERQFQKSGSISSLRAIAALYAENVHLVVRNDGPIHTLGDLAGRRVSVGERESGTLSDAVLVLDAAGLGLQRITPVYEKLSAAVEDLRKGTIDALFMVAGPPVPAIVDLAAGTPIRLVPIDGPVRETLKQQLPFFEPAAIKADTYGGQHEAVQTLGIRALWVVPSTTDDQLVFELTRALWHEDMRKALEAGSPVGRQIRLEHALDGVSIPLHPGAQKFYKGLGNHAPSPMPPIVGPGP